MKKVCRKIYYLHDTLEMALKSADADLNAEDLLPKLKENRTYFKSFLTTFEKHNITKVDTDGEFDPNVHNAVIQVDIKRKSWSKGK